jgi:hypothetical protein
MARTRVLVVDDNVTSVKRAIANGNLLEDTDPDDFVRTFKAEFVVE